MATTQQEWVKLSSLKTGTVVQVPHAGAVYGYYGSYIVVHHNYKTVNGKPHTLLLSQYAMKQGRFNDDSSGMYNGSKMDIWMQSYVDEYIGNSMKPYIPLVDIQCQIGLDDDKRTTYIKRKAFALSATEAGYSRVPTEGFKLPYLNSTSARKCKSVTDNDDVSYFLRTVSFTQVHNLCFRVKTNGEFGDSCIKPMNYWYRPAFCIPGDITVNKQVLTSSGTVRYEVYPNTPPNAPASVTVPMPSVYSDSAFYITWTESYDMDTDGTRLTYEVEKTVDGGETWTLIGRFTGNTLSTTDSIPYGLAEMVAYRVRCVDPYQQSSNYTVSQYLNIINNTAPSTPSKIYCSAAVRGSSVTVGWSKATDAEDNLSGYVLERSIDGESTWQSIYNGTAVTFNDSIDESWETISYRVHAYDRYNAKSGYRTTGLIETIIPVSISITQKEDSDFIDNPFFSSDDPRVLKLHISNSYDPDFAGRYECYVKIGNTELYASENIESDVNCQISKQVWQTILNGNHEIIVTVRYHDGEEIYVKQESIPFLKRVQDLRFRLEKPILATDDQPICKCLINVKGHLPVGSSISIEVTNNANDDSPVWQTVEANDINSGKFLTISNQSAVNGYAFNVRVAASRGTAEEKCYLESINGMVGENIFELINNRLRALEEYHG